MDKSFLTSKTIWGLILMGVGFLADRWGFNVDAATQLDLVDMIVAAVPEVMEVVGMALGIWGRIKATKGIKLV